MAKHPKKITKLALAELELANSGKPFRKAFAENVVADERRTLFNRECFFAQNAGLMGDYNLTSKPGSMAATIDSAATERINSYLGLYFERSASMAAPMERFLTVGEGTDPFRCQAAMEMAKQGIKAGDMLEVEKRIAVAVDDETSFGRRSGPISLELAVDCAESLPNSLDGPHVCHGQRRRKSRKVETEGGRKEEA